MKLQEAGADVLSGNVGEVITQMIQTSSSSASWHVPLESSFQAAKNPPRRELQQGGSRDFWPGNGAIAALPVPDFLYYAKAAVGDIAIGTVRRMTDGYFGCIGPRRDWYETTFPR